MLHEISWNAGFQWIDNVHMDDKQDINGSYNVLLIDKNLYLRVILIHFFHVNR